MLLKHLSIRKKKLRNSTYEVNKIYLTIWRGWARPLFGFPFLSLWQKGAETSQSSWNKAGLSLKGGFVSSKDPNALAQFKAPEHFPASGRKHSAAR